MLEVYSNPHDYNLFTREQVEVLLARYVGISFPFASKETDLKYAKEWLDNNLPAPPKKEDKL